MTFQERNFSTLLDWLRLQYELGADEAICEHETNKKDFALDHMDVSKVFLPLLRVSQEKNQMLREMGEKNKKAISLKRERPPSQQRKGSGLEEGISLLPGAPEGSPSPTLSSPYPSPILRSAEGAIATAQDLAGKAHTLGELRQALEKFDDCSLKLTAMRTVFADGAADAKIMAVGEAPGADEDRQGKPFVGLSGQLLDRMFAAIGISRQINLYISNILPWRPPGNRQPTVLESEMCLPFIQRHIELIQPTFLILLGGTAAKTLLRTSEGIMRLRGKWQTYKSPGLSRSCQTLAMFHPAYLLRSPGQKAYAWQDLLKLQQALRGLSS